MSDQKKALIIGGGFGGVSSALEILKLDPKNIKITLISDRPHFEYHGALYRLVSGKSPLEICIPLREIFHGKPVEVLQDKIVDINLKKKVCLGESGAGHKYDYLILAVGNQTSYLNISGLKKHSYGFKSISEALKLKNHLHKTFEKAKKEKLISQKKSATHIVIIGGGSSGTELAAELSFYTKRLCINHGINPKLAQIDLIHSKNRLIAELPKDMSIKIQDRLKKLGVNLVLNNKVTKEDAKSVFLKNAKIKTNTLIWTAGASTHHLHKNSKRFSFLNNKVQVNKHLQATGHKLVFVAGDNTNTKYSGMAQTAIAHGKTIARNIVNLENKTPLVPHAQKAPIYAVPVGSGWAATKVNNNVFYGSIGWLLRRYLDWKVFSYLLPTKKALTVFKNGRTLNETCFVCESKL
ncbi:NAD(P)/FAD-dependent oxidoreductase [Patescibacteria group bacterium]